MTSIPGYVPQQQRPCDEKKWCESKPSLMFQNVNSVEYSFKMCEEDTNVDVYIVDQSGKSLSASNGWSTKWYQTIDFGTLHTTHWPSAKLVAVSAAENVCANSCTPGVNT